MDETVAVNPVQLGRYLAQVRERAGIKQAELARRVTWSPAVLSRAESGERSLAPEEIEALLAEIGTSEAASLRAALQRDWMVLPRPSLDHPDQDLLWEAEQAAQALVIRRDDPDIRNSFQRRLSALVGEIENVAGLLLKREHQVAFVGSIGVGKSTAICRATGLELPAEDGGQPTPVLEVGAGGVTICEVHLRSGPGYGLLVEPRADEEIRADVTDFAEYLTSRELVVADDAERSDEDQQGISKEIERAIRNMAGLRVRREKGPEGKRVQRDEGKELARTVSSVRELVVEILARMELHRRDRRDVWYDPGCGKPALRWLKDTFEQVNNGRHPEFTLPRRIEVVVPEDLLGLSELSLRIVDTKGIDRTAARADLEDLLDDTHTIAVLCSNFNNAPAAEARLLLERAREAGVRSIESHVALLVFPRTGEALAAKDETGLRVETAEEGYWLKEEQVSLSLQPLGLDGLSVGFFDAYQDAPATLQRFLVERLRSLRSDICSRLRAIIANAQSVLANYEREQVQEVVRQAGQMLRSWIKQQSNPRPLTAHVSDSLMDQLGHAYASTIRATVRREGEWPNLSYSHHLGFGARRLAVLALEQHVAGFNQLCETLLGNAEFIEARDLISQTERVLTSAYEEILRKVQLMGQTSFKDELRKDVLFWVECNSEWGQGPGYRTRVADRNVTWFSDERRKDLERELWSLVEREWQAALSAVSSLLDLEE